MKKGKGRALVMEILMSTLSDLANTRNNAIKGVASFGDIESYAKYCKETIEATIEAEEFFKKAWHLIVSDSSIDNSQ